MAPNAEEEAPLIASMHIKPQDSSKHDADNPQTILITTLLT